MSRQNPHYQSYLLRFWQDYEGATWHARLERIGKEGKVIHMADAKQLLDLVNEAAHSSHEAETFKPAVDDP